MSEEKTAQKQKSLRDYCIRRYGLDLARLLAPIDGANRCYDGWLWGDRSWENCQTVGEALCWMKSTEHAPAPPQYDGEWAAQRFFLFTAIGAPPIVNRKIQGEALAIAFKINPRDVLNELTPKTASRLLIHLGALAHVNLYTYMGDYHGSKAVHNYLGYFDLLFDYASPHASSAVNKRFGHELQHIVRLMLGRGAHFSDKLVNGGWIGLDLLIRLLLVEPIAQVADSLPIYQKHGVTMVDFPEGDMPLLVRELWCAEQRNALRTEPKVPEYLPVAVLTLSKVCLATQSGDYEQRVKPQLER